MDEVNQSKIWSFDTSKNLSMQSTTPASLEMPEEEVTGAVTTLIVVSLSIILAIAMLFILAVFIDCRHQKKVRQQCVIKNKKSFKLRLPGRQIREPTSIVEDAEATSRTVAPMETITEIV